MLDVVTVVSDSTPRPYLSQCRQSIHVAVDLAPFPARAVESPAIAGNIGAAMQQAAELGDAPYVTWVDDDDFVLPSAFRCLANHFHRQPIAIYAREMQLMRNGRLVPIMHRHHPLIVRRDVLEDMPLAGYATHTSTDMRRWLEGVAGAEIIDELSWVYVYRRWRSPGSYLRAAGREGSLES